MEPAPPAAEPHGAFRQSPDEDHNLRAVAVGLMALTLFAIATVCAYLILRAGAPSGVPQTARLAAPTPPPAQVGNVFQWTFDPRSSRPPLDALAAERLRTFGPADARGTRWRMPIDEAMRIYLREQQP